MPSIFCQKCGERIRYSSGQNSRLVLNNHQCKSSLKDLSVNEVKRLLNKLIEDNKDKSN